jgi:hypothetical protein
MLSAVEARQRAATFPKVSATEIADWVATGRRTYAAVWPSLAKPSGQDGPQIVTPTLNRIEVRDLSGA